jgi:hypothetical protein
MLQLNAEVRWSIHYKELRSQPKADKYNAGKHLKNPGGKLHAPFFFLHGLLTDSSFTLTSS